MLLTSLAPLLFLPPSVLSFVVLPEAAIFNSQPEPVSRIYSQPDKPDHLFSSSDESDPLPVIIWHGLGDSANADGLKAIASLLNDIHPGIYVHIISLGNNPGDPDRSQSFFGNLTAQIEKVCHDISHEPILSTAPAIDAIGFSQGGQFIRGYIERCGDGVVAPKVRSLITFGSQHNGISEFERCESATDWVCQGANAILKSSTVWSDFVQSRLIPAQYYRDTNHYDEYLLHSNFLADINNERESKTPEYAHNLRLLQNFVMVLFKDDKTVIPKESGWFAEVETLKDGEKEIRKVTQLRDRRMYKQDWLGLRDLDERGGLVFEEVEGEHMHLKDKDLKRLFGTYFGGKDKKFGRKEGREEL